MMEVGFTTAKRLNLGCKLLKFNRFAVVKSACVVPEFHSGLFMFNRFAVMDYA